MTTAISRSACLANYPWDCRAIREICRLSNPGGISGIVHRGRECERGAARDFLPEYATRRVAWVESRFFVRILTTPRAVLCPFAALFQSVRVPTQVSALS